MRSILIQLRRPRSRCRLSVIARRHRHRRGMHNDRNQLIQVAGNSVTEDYNGNMTQDNTGQQYVFDGWDREVTVKNSSGTPTRYFTYDPLKRRITDQDASCGG